MINIKFKIMCDRIRWFLLFHSVKFIKILQTWVCAMSLSLCMYLRTISVYLCTTPELNNLFSTYYSNTLLDTQLDWHHSWFALQYYHRSHVTGCTTVFFHSISVIHALPQLVNCAKFLVNPTKKILLVRWMSFNKWFHLKLFIYSGTWTSGIRNVSLGNYPISI